MAGIDLKITFNAKDVIKKTKLYSDRVLKEAKDELMTTALEIETEAKKGSPVDTGRLRSSVHVITKNTDSYTYKDKRGNNFNGAVNGTGADLNKLRLSVGTNVVYSPIQEAKNMFLRDAINKKGKGLVKRISDILNK